jgi:hypothetical protein
LLQGPLLPSEELRPRGLLCGTRLLRPGLRQISLPASRSGAYSIPVRNAPRQNYKRSGEIFSDRLIVSWVADAYAVSYIEVFPTY